MSTGRVSASRAVRNARHLVAGVSALICASLPLTANAQDSGPLPLPPHEEGDTYVYDIDGKIVPEVVRQGVAGHYVWELGASGVELRYADPTSPAPAPNASRLGSVGGPIAWSLRTSACPTWAGSS